MPEQLSFLFTGCSSVQFLNSPPYPNTVSQETFGTLPFTVQYLCALYAMPFHWFQVLPTQPLPTETEDFSRGGKYSKDVPLPTFLDYLQPV